MSASSASTLRVGLHTRECELHDGKLAGIAVSVGSRVAGEAGPGQVVVSGTVRDLVAGSGIEFGTSARAWTREVGCGRSHVVIRLRK